jgi:predicted Rossmann fold flavoprotein
MESDICIIGAGPAGMMAAIAAAGAKKVIIIESNTTAGRKLLLTGGGRCNLTHTGSVDEIIKAYKPFDRFVRHCIHEFSPQKLMEFVHRRGVETVVEQSGCVFPKTQNASDVQQILLEEMKKLNIRIFYGKKVISIEKQNEHFVILSDKFSVSSQSVIIATGGASWPQTGSTGDGYKFAQKLGHKIIKPLAVVVPLVTTEKFCSSLAGISVQNVLITCKINGKKISSSGAMIFTHSGIGGPAVFDMSRNIANMLDNNPKISVDFLPKMKTDQLDKMITAGNPRQNIVSVFLQFLPKALIKTICAENNIPEIGAGQINKKSRKILVEKLKNFPFTVLRTEPIEKATVTRGGVDTAQIESKTMESKLCGKLFFAGEVINVDGPCGGYNLQFAFSSGVLAGKSAAQSLE